MVVALPVGVGYEPDLLEEVGFDGRADEGPGVAEVDLDELAEAGGVVLIVEGLRLFGER